MDPVVLRPALPSDMPLIRNWHREQNERDGTNYPLTELFKPNGTLAKNVPAALVGIQHGEPLGSIYVELVPELMFAGCNPKLTAFSRREIDAMLTVLSWQGYRGLNCRVPQQVLSYVSKPLKRAGFESMEGKLVNFFRDFEEV